jgi:hypothetical protein
VCLRNLFAWLPISAFIVTNLPIQDSPGFSLADLIFREVDEFILTMSAV